LKITLKEIAEKAGVSISLVSKVLNNKDVSVSAEKRETIIRVAKELKSNKVKHTELIYTTKSSGIIALIQPSLKCDFLIKLTEQIELQASQFGYSVLVLNTHEDITKERDFLYLCDKSFIKGIIANVSDNNANIDLLKHLASKGIPLVFIDRYIPEQELSFVSTDNFNGSYILTKELISRGNKNILFIFHGKSLFTTAQLDRFAGYQKKMIEHGLESQKEYIHSDRPINTQPIYGDVSFLQDIDAILLATSWDFLFLLSILEEINFSPSKKLDIGMFDHFSLPYPGKSELQLINRYFSNILIMEQDYTAIATHAVDALMNQVIHKSKKIEQKFLRATLYVF